MTRVQLEHILRASAGITGADQFVIIGSQAVLGQFPNAPAELLVSNEADVFSLRSPDPHFSQTHHGGTETRRSENVLARGRGIVEHAHSPDYRRKGMPLILNPEP